MRRAVDKKLRDVEDIAKGTQIPQTVETVKDTEVAESGTKGGGIFEAVKRAVTRSED